MSAVEQIGAVRELEDQRGALRRYVRSLVAPDLDRADDIVQETLLRAWQHRDRLDRDDRPVRLWLFRIARNLVIDAWRKDRTVAFGLAPDAERVDRMDLAENVSERHLLIGGLLRLPPAQREVLLHVYLLGRGTDDVARTLRIPAGTVKSRTHHAVRALRQALTDVA